MGERKVQSKYYPPDFDPSKLPRAFKKKQNDDAVRFMLPMSVRCESCGEFMGTGLKFNARKSLTGEDYLGIRILRFSMRCKACPASFSILTDPKNSGYACGSGARRNYEPWREEKELQKEEEDERSRQDQDAMQALENKTLDAKQQMEDLDALDNIKSQNSKRARVAIDDVIQRVEQGTRLDVTEEREIDQQVQFLLSRRQQDPHSSSRRQPSQGEGTYSLSTPPLAKSSIITRKSGVSGKRQLLGILPVVVKPRKKANAPANASNLASTMAKPIVEGYGGSTSSDSD